MLGGHCLRKSLPASGSLATVDMKDFAGQEMRSFKIENSINDGTLRSANSGLTRMAPGRADLP
jgi:hypothetical protein